MTKQELRKEIRESAKQLDPGYFTDASDRIAERVLDSAEYRSAACVFLYISMPTEPDTGRIIADALQSGKRVLVPRCLTKPYMEAVEIKSMDDLMTDGTAYGIPEPEKHLAAADASQIDLILAPCVAASREGVRLGHGAAYYDTFIGRPEVAPKAILCLCFEKFIRDDIPEEGHDRRMDRIVTETGEYKGGLS